MPPYVPHVQTGGKRCIVKSRDEKMWIDKIIGIDLYPLV